MQRRLEAVARPMAGDVVAHAMPDMARPVDRACADCRALMQPSRDVESSWTNLRVTGGQNRGWDGKRAQMDQSRTARRLRTGGSMRGAGSMGGDSDCACEPTSGAAAAAAAAAAEQPRVKVEPTDADARGAGADAGDAHAADLSRYDELMRTYTEPYAIAAAPDAELADGVRLGRKERRERRDALTDSAPRLACYPRLLNEVRALASAGRRGDVVRMLTVGPGRGGCSSPRHSMPFSSRDEGSKRVV